MGCGAEVSQLQALKVCSLIFTLGEEFWESLTCLVAFFDCLRWADDLSIRSSAFIETVGPVEELAKNVITPQIDNAVVVGPSFVSGMLFPFV